MNSTTIKGQALDALYTLAASAKVISFDFFDTLFTRPLTDPEDAFDLIGAQYNVPEFRQLRRKAQADAFRQMVKEKRKEITLTGIYQHFSAGNLPAETLKQAEYDLELKLVQPNPELFDLFRQWREQGKEVVITSDMYFGRDFFLKVLKRYGITDVPLFISADCNATKRDTGELFDYIIRQYHVEPKEILHIGDNYLADVQRPQEKGLLAFHYQPQPPIEKNKGESLVSSLTKGMLRCDAEQRIKPGTFEEFGYRYQAPATLGFLRWISEQCRQDNIDTLLFVSRDGYTLEKMASGYDGITLPSFHYFMGSRIAFNLALMDEANYEQHLAFLMSGADGLSPGELLERIGLEPPVEKIMTEIGLPATLIIGPENYDLVRKFLMAYRAEIVKICRRNRRGLYMYLHLLGIRSGSRVALVDVGWSGTTQEAFERAVKPMLDISVVGYYFCLANTHERRRREATHTMKALVNASAAPASMIDSIYENRMAAELFFSAPHNTIIGYQPVGQRVVPIDDPGRAKAKDHNQINARLNQGVDIFMEDYPAFEKRMEVTLSPWQLAQPLIELVSNDKWRAHELFRMVENFDSWGSSRNQTVKFEDYFKH
ncbi:HAD family hydrolase [Chimaeribacter californicus]|uniref:HAD family hydrolase n=1 Tax=Chimaeribacter californicus TaxID=2060067 RepID=UPI0011AF93E6|nr:HAD family hydrolase [Chimaeribacter californicus]